MLFSSHVTIPCIEVPSEASQRMGHRLLWTSPAVGFPSARCGSHLTPDDPDSTPIGGDGAPPSFHPMLRHAARCVAPHQPWAVPRSPSPASWPTPESSPRCSVSRPVYLGFHPVSRLFIRLETFLELG